ncbi:glycosyltransferase [Methylotenera sp. N17]|uniref:glycosyltransferase n=1 Tax=Methylotenera sp. N17 TaxID=1502761 RepID=UPI000B2A9DE2|nr:glycosyltransferase [Methylotenera sp. N17]
MQPKRLHLLYFTAEQWPTFRPDVVALFGKYLPRHGVTCDLVTDRDIQATSPLTAWGGGQAIVCNMPQSRIAQYVVKMLHNLKTLCLFDAQQYDAIQVRDMSVTAVFALLAARVKGLPFYYWLSYPQSEGQIDRAKKRGYRAGMRYFFPLLQGYIGQWLLYYIVLKRADHVFVQSQQMRLDLVNQGIPFAQMTPVPMGVDTEAVSLEQILPSDDARLAGKRVLIYLGTMDPVRHIEILFQMLAIVKQHVPNVLMVLAGDVDDVAYRAWLRAQADTAGVSDYVLWNGWQAATQAWRYVRAAELGLSPVPRSYLLDMGSPTKAVEYMALGVPVIGNDNPDQQQVITESGAGVCVPYTAEQFAQAVIQLLQSPHLTQDMAAKGRAYVLAERGYDSISSEVASTYHRIHRKR